MEYIEFTLTQGMLSKSIKKEMFESKILQISRKSLVFEAVPVRNISSGFPSASTFFIRESIKNYVAP